ncbi:hypothetical protein A0J61_04394 [Choanephora cucurbitarum]|uniref:Uncharacterized protein n=1 Tax=Choanephora cucurbitarum TaxID=101091 RepID=A0A1C7NFM6_9FUNG|nr:hypothetical protein A0J61_04394 [Choanephora cucurbitarum]
MFIGNYNCLESTEPKCCSAGFAEKLGSSLYFVDSYCSFDYINTLQGCIGLLPIITAANITKGIISSFYSFSLASTIQSSFFDITLEDPSPK